MDDDFNTADALAAIFELVKYANTNVDETAQGSLPVVFMRNFLSSREFFAASIRSALKFSGLL